MSLFRFKSIFSSFLKLNIKKNKMYEYRNKPIIIIFGCTGTGKTKLSIELAKQYKNQAEIINADAIQLYEGLDVVTNKATIDEMQGIPHHLIGYLDSLYKDYSVHDYKRKAIDLIDNLLKNDKLPIIVGGTSYYIESVLWDIVIEDPMDSVNKRKNVSDEFYEKNKEEIENLFDSKLTNEEIFKQLEIVDAQSAEKIHPNDRRKLCRALEIYYQHGVNKSDLIRQKNEQDGAGLYRGALRYKNACIYFLNCENEILNKRLDDRVDDMIKKGLVDELKDFYTKIKSRIDDKSIAEYSQKFQVGIFQAIGFKEFNDYLNMSDEEKLSEKGRELFLKGVEDMKQVTRKYAKKQTRWTMNRFVKRSNQYSPDVYELDTSDLNKWNENVFDKAFEIFQCFIEKRPCKYKPFEKAMKDEVIFENKFCEICNKTFINKSQWNEHINGRSHKKHVEYLKNQEKIKEYKVKKQEKKSDDDQLTL